LFGKSAGIVNQKWIARIVLVAFAFCTFPIPTPNSRTLFFTGENGGTTENCSGRQCQCATKGIGESCCCYGTGQQSQPASSDEEADMDGPGPMLKKQLALSFELNPKEKFCGSSKKKQPAKGEVSRPNVATRSVAKANPKSTHRLRILSMESKKCTSNGFDLANASWMTAPALLSIEFEQPATKHVASLVLELDSLHFPPVTPPPRTVA